MKIKSRTYRTSFLVACMLVSCFMIKAQDLNKEVFVVRPYEPTLVRCCKIQFPASGNFNGIVNTGFSIFHFTKTPSEQL